MLPCPWKPDTALGSPLTCKLWRRQARGLEAASSGSCPWKSWSPSGPCRLGGRSGCWAWRRGFPINEGPEPGFSPDRSPTWWREGGQAVNNVTLTQPSPGCSKVPHRKSCNRTCFCMFSSNAQYILTKGNRIVPPKG